MLKNPLKKLLDPDYYPDHPQNLISSSSSHCRHFLKISSNSAHKVLSYVAKRQTQKQPNKPCQKHNLLGRGNYSVCYYFNMYIFEQRGITIMHFNSVYISDIVYRIKLYPFTSLIANKLWCSTPVCIVDQCHCRGH